MAVNSNTVETFDVTTLREDLQEALEMVSATDAPFMSAIGNWAPAHAKQDLQASGSTWIKPIVELAMVSQLGTIQLRFASECLQNYLAVEGESSSLQRQPA